MRTSKETPGFGDCWWEALSDQAKLHNIKSIINLTPNEIRQKVISNIKNCPSYKTWLNVTFKSNVAANKFINAQLKPNTYTDMDGIVVLASCEVLELTAHIYTFSSSRKVPKGTYNHGQRKAVLIL